VVPDHFDYEWLSEFCGKAQNWGPDELATARSMLADQRRALDESHPSDRKTRKRLQHVVNQLKRAIESYGG
jgi:hypothetical protein